VLWLTTYLLHYINKIRPSPDDVKVGGHQASSASLVSLLTALYCTVLRPEDRIAIKPHAAPVFHVLTQPDYQERPRVHLLASGVMLTEALAASTTALEDGIYANVLNISCMPHCALSGSRPLVNRPLCPICTTSMT